MNSQIVSIKPLSTNEAWKGRRFKTDKYKRWQDEFMVKMKMTTIPEGKLGIFIQLGFSSRGSDIDNPVKMIFDTIAEKAKARGLKFNDNQLYKLDVEKHIVPKGKEFITFGIYKMTD